jgi:hypothetical protein
MLPKDFVQLLEVDYIGSQQSLEDLALIQLYRGYSLQLTSSWVCTLMICV